jgi:hypothetical protein
VVITIPGFQTTTMTMMVMMTDIIVMNKGTFARTRIPQVSPLRLEHPKHGEDEH